MTSGFEVIICFSTMLQMKHKHNYRASTELLYAEAELDGILSMLSESDLEEKGDILQFLVDTYGLEYDTGELIQDKL